jgi:hypothetical protein
MPFNRIDDKIGGSENPAEATVVNCLKQAGAVSAASNWQETK